MATNAFKASWSPDGAKLVYDSMILRDLRLDAPACAGVRSSVVC